MCVDGDKIGNLFVCSILKDKASEVRVRSLEMLLLHKPLALIVLMVEPGIVHLALKEKILFFSGKVVVCVHCGNQWFNLIIMLNNGPLMARWWRFPPA